MRQKENGEAASVVRLGKEESEDSVGSGGEMKFSTPMNTQGFYNCNLKGSPN